MNTTLYSPNRLFAYDPHNNKWEPTEHNKFPDWKNSIVSNVFKPDERGISKWIQIEDLKHLYPQQAAQFGGNGSNYFSRNSPICEFTLENQQGKGITARRTIGLNHEASQDASRGINPKILRIIRSQPCAVTGSTSTIECDHRSGRYPPNACKDTQTLNDFQPLSKCVNNIKRNACQRCIRSRSRFDARILGSPIGWTIGDASSTSCEGCFWFNPREFFSLITPPPDPS